MGNREKSLIRIDLRPNELIKGDNQVVVVAWNHSQDTCEGLSILLRCDDNLYVGSGSRLRFPPLRSDEMLSSAIDLTALDVGPSVIELRCSWKQRNRTYYQDITFQLNVKEDSDTQAEPSGESSYLPTYLKEYYWNNMSHWNKMLQLKQKELHHLELQAARWGQLDVPFRIVDQIESLKKEISDLCGKIEMAEAYLARTE
jgi:hypothetical protein